MSVDKKIVILDLTRIQKVVAFYWPTLYVLTVTESICCMLFGLTTGTNFGGIALVSFILLQGQHQVFTF